MLRDVTPYNYELHNGDRVTLRVERQPVYAASSTQSTLHESVKVLDVVAEGTDGSGHRQWVLREKKRRADGSRQHYHMGRNQLSISGRDGRGRPVRYEIIAFVKVEKGAADQGLGALFGAR